MSTSRRCLFRFGFRHYPRASQLKQGVMSKTAAGNFSTRPSPIKLYQRDPTVKLRNGHLYRMSARNYERGSRSSISSADDAARHADVCRKSFAMQGQLVLMHSAILPAPPRPRYRHFSSPNASVIILNNMYFFDRCCGLSFDCRNHVTGCSRCRVVGDEMKNAGTLDNLPHLRLEHIYIPSPVEVDKKNSHILKTSIVARSISRRSFRYGYILSLIMAEMLLPFAALAGLASAAPQLPGLSGLNLGLGANAAASGK